MRVFLTSSIASVLILVTGSGPAVAKVKKGDCKAHAATIERLAGELGMSDAGGGRGLLDQVQTWIGKKSDTEVDAMAAALEAALSGVKECESNGFYAQVSGVKSQCLTIKSAVLPWLKNAAALDPCQETITKAIEQRESDPDAAIVQFEQAIGECRDITWIREARRQLAEAHFLRGDLSRSDFASGRSQVQQTMATLAEMDPQQRGTVIAILASATVGAGKSLMDNGSFDEAALHWEAYIETFGTSDFEPMFATQTVSDGAYGLRSLRDANYQWALACLEAGNAECVLARVEASAADPAEQVDALEALVGRGFALAGEASGAGGDPYFGVAFDLLDRWHTDKPDSYQIKRMLQNEVLDRPTPERLTLLRLTDHCWIPTEIAGMLREEGHDFVEEATLAASCGGGNGEAAAMLTAVDEDRARDLLDKIVLASSTSERRSYESQLESVLNAMGGSEAEREIRGALRAWRDRQRVQAVNVRDNSAEIYADCTTILATIQWNESREDDYSAEVRNFKSGCCSYLRKNRAGWVKHLKSKLGDDQVRAKQRLMDDYCN